MGEYWRVLYRELMYQSNRSLNIPPGIPRAFDVFCCPGGREFDELSFPGAGHLITTHRRWGIWSLASISCYVALIPRGVINHGGDKPWCIQSERYLILGGLAEKQRLAQALLCIWRYSRTIRFIFGLYKECCLLNHVYIHSFRSIIEATEKFPDLNFASYALYIYPCYRWNRTWYTPRGWPGARFSKAPVT